MKLKEICLNITDGTHSTVLDCPNGNNYLLSCKNIKSGRVFINKNDRRIDDKTLLFLRNRTHLELNDVVITSVGTIGEVALIDDEPNYEFQRSVAILKPNQMVIHPKYLKYFLMSKYGQAAVKGRIKGAAQPCLFLNDIRDIDIPMVNMSVQQHIVNTIGTIDDLIEKKTQILKKLEELTKLLYLKHKNQRVGTLTLGESCDIRTGKLDANAEEKNGKYPFFTCGQDTLRINNYAFDCEAIIVAGNGEISVRYYKGKFNAYQRTYVLSPAKLFYLFLEECKLSINDLKTNSQGSVIKFITKGMLENIKIVNDNDAIIINQNIGVIYNHILKVRKQLDFLNKIKEKLLSKYF